MDFPHLKDTQFPLINNVNVYKYKNNFDYARWNGKVSFKLLNVLWNSNYADVPYFDTVEERDEWFDSQDGYVGTLESLFNNTPENTVKIPIPYNDAYNYNYLVVDMPMQTSVDNPINFEDNKRISRWFYFIEDLTQFAPSTTELRISVDYWTTFIHSVEIPYLMLERGHAPMMQITPEQFLANPIANNEYLLADDFDYGTDTIVSSSNYIPIGNGKKYVLFCAPYSSVDFDRFGGREYTNGSTPPTYSDTQERWGYKLEVNDYEWRYGNADYSNADLPIVNMVQTGILNGCECFAIEGSQAQSFFSDCTKNCVNFIHGIKAMFILDEALFNRTSSFTFRGFTLYIADNKINNLSIPLTKQLFNFDSKYADITKLYTFPYSALEITDDDGNVFSAKVENTGNIQMYEEVSLIYPYLNYNVFFTGINGNGTMPYTWMNVQDTVDNRNMWASDFGKYMMNWDIPTYSIYVSQETEYAVSNFFRKRAEREGAIKDYQNAVRYGNTTAANTADSFNTNTANVGRKTAADIANTNSTNTNLQNVRTNEIARNTDLMTLGNTFNLNLTTLNSGKIGDDYAYAIDFSRAGLNYTHDTATASVVSGGINSVTQFASSAIGAIGGEDKMQNIASAAVNSVGGFIGTAYGAYATVTNNSAYELATEDIGAGQAANNQHILEEQNRYQRALNVDTTTENNTRDQNNTTYQKNLNTAITDTNTTMENANALATQNTETANANYNRNATQAAEDANLRWKQFAAERDYLGARLQPPAEFGGYSGNMFKDAYKRRGVRFNVRTQSKSAIAQAGDAMLRFGYALHRVWDMSLGFHYCKEFTFWKAEDIWINDGSGVANVATNTIAEILLKGVTIWRDPNKIGTVGIYDNI